MSCAGTFVSRTLCSRHSRHAGHWKVNPRLRNASAGRLGCQRCSIGGNLQAQELQSQGLWQRPLEGTEGLMRECCCALMVRGGRALEKVAAQHELDAAEGPLVAPNVARLGLRMLPELGRHHADLIHHKDLGPGSSAVMHLQQVSHRVLETMQIACTSCVVASPAEQGCRPGCLSIKRQAIDWLFRCSDCCKRSASRCRRAEPKLLLGKSAWGLGLDLDTRSSYLQPSFIGIQNSLIFESTIRAFAW